MTPVAIGSDTGGSIRSPACYCGVVGLKPTFGAIAPNGFLPLSTDLDTVGPLAARVADAAISAVSMGLANAASRLGKSIEGFAIGYARDWFAHDPATHPAVLLALDRAMSSISLLGARVELTTLPDYSELEKISSVILNYQAFELHRRTLPDGRYGRMAIESLKSGQSPTLADFEAAREQAQ